MIHASYEVANQTEHHLWRPLRRLFCHLLTPSRTMPEKTISVCRQGGGYESLPSQVHWAQGCSQEPLWHCSWRPFQPSRARGGRLQFPPVWESQKFWSLCDWGKRKFLDREVWSAWRGRNEQKKLRIMSHSSKSGSQLDNRCARHQVCRQQSSKSSTFYNMFFVCF